MERKPKKDARYTLGDELQRVAKLLTRFPEVGSRCRNVKLLGVRRVHLTSVRHDLYYRVRESSIEIVALRHSSRDMNPNE